MKKIKYIALATAGIAVAGVVSVPSAVAGIADTKHNLVSTVGSNNTTTGTDEICVFCHTPHGADSTRSIPLWNRHMETAPETAFTTYNSLGSSTLDGTIIDVGSVSLACLSCHDGTIAMDSLLNSPGSGTVDVAPGEGLPWTWNQGTGTTLSIDGAGRLDVGIANLGQDLSDDHPVGILYAGGNVVGNETNSGSFKDPDFEPVSTKLINGDRYWWVDLNGDDQRQRTDLILYSRTSTNPAHGVSSPAPFVECASCHDPHVSDKPLFLRVDNAGSALCLACHVK